MYHNDTPVAMREVPIFLLSCLFYYGDYIVDKIFSDIVEADGIVIHSSPTLSTEAVCMYALSLRLTIENRTFGGCSWQDE